MWQIFVGKSVNIHREFTNEKYFCKYIISPKFELCSDHHSGQLCHPGVFNEDPTVWLDTTKPAGICIPPSFLGCAHVVPTPKFWWIACFWVSKFIGSEKCCQWLFSGGKSLKSRDNINVYQCVWVDYCTVITVSTVEHQTIYDMIAGSNPGTAWHREKMEEKMFFQHSSSF